jgi:hypothetical protein
MRNFLRQSFFHFFFHNKHVHQHCTVYIHFFSFIFFWRARVCRPLLRLCRPFMIFEGCLDSNPECCRSKLARYRLSHPSQYRLSHPSQNRLSHPTPNDLATHPSTDLATHPYRLSHPSLRLSHPSPDLATHPPT